MIYELTDKKTGSERICAKIVYSTENPLLQGKSEEEIKKQIDDQIKLINKDLPVYKYIREFTLTTDPLIKTTTGKIKRFEELKRL